MRLRISIFLLGVCALLNVYATQPVLTTMARDLHVDPALATWTVSATTLGVAAAAVVAGAVSGRFGRKAVMMAALAATVIVTLGCAAAGDFAVLLVLRFAQGLLMPFVFAVAVAYIAEERLADSPAITNALYVSGTAFGGFCGRFLAAAVASVAGWRASFLALALVSVAVLAVVAAWLPTERTFQRSSLGAGVRGIRAQLRDRRLLGTCLVGGSLLFLQVGSFTFAGLHLQGAPFRLSTVQVGAVFAVLLVAVVVTPLTGRLVDRFGRRPTYLMAGTLALAGLVLTLVPTTAAIVVGLAASSVGVFSGQTCATGQAAQSRTGERSAAVGLYLTCYYLGGSVGGVVLAPVYSASGWRACVALLAVVVALGMVVAFVAWRPARVEAPPTRIDSLTAEQQARITSFAQEWIERGRRTQPLTDQEWQTWDQAVRRCYEYAGVPWPGVVVRVPSPIMGDFAAPVCCFAARRLRGEKVEKYLRNPVDRAIYRAVHTKVREALYEAVVSTVTGDVYRGVATVVRAAVSDPVSRLVGKRLGAVWHGAMEINGREHVDGADDIAFQPGGLDALADVVGTAVTAVGGPGEQVTAALYSAIENVIGERVHDLPVREVRGALNAMRCYTGEEYFGGTLVGWPRAFVAFFRDVVGLKLGGDLWERSRDFDAANTAGPWWPFADFVMVCDVPTVLELEQIRPPGPRSHQLHCVDGPAVAWNDGWGIQVEHGTPQGLDFEVAQPHMTFVW